MVRRNQAAVTFTYELNTAAKVGRVSPQPHVCLPNVKKIPESLVE